MRTQRQQEASLRNLKLVTRSYEYRRVLFKCINCGLEKRIAPSVAYGQGGKKFCSWKCRMEFMRGENAPNSGGGQWMFGKNNPNWKDGRGYERKCRHKMPEVNHWRRCVYARDRYTCVLCGYRATKGDTLNAHHIEPWAENEEKRFDVSNGMTLCKPCHKNLHIQAKKERRCGNGTGNEGGNSGG